MARAALKICITVFASICTLFLLMYAIGSASALPDVHVSYSTNQCAKVVNYAEGDAYTCDTLPVKYHFVWVE